MDYRRYHDAWAVRLDPGEEIAACLADISRREDIRTAAVVGLGAANEVEAGLFDTRTKGYRANVWRGDMAVSYTHLDVYKRQRHILPFGPGRLLFQASSPGAPCP